MALIFFANQADFRCWLEEHHQSETELFVGYYKVKSGKLNMTWSQSVDQALCFGWIDGLRKSIDENSYFIRFTPRKPTSVWSAVNIKKVEELTRQGLMCEAGIIAFNKRKDEKSKIYSFENVEKALAEDLMNKFKANMPAWYYFSKQQPSYQNAVLNCIMSSKQETTTLARLNKVIIASEELKRLQ
jgi:uncharacterized protein YdeI (YjbR/CyaY-like superfamily)